MIKHLEKIVKYYSLRSRWSESFVCLVPSPILTNIFNMKLGRSVYCKSCLWANISFLFLRKQSNWKKTHTTPRCYISHLWFNKTDNKFSWVQMTFHGLFPSLILLPHPTLNCHLEKKREKKWMFLTREAGLIGKYKTLKTKKAQNPKQWNWRKRISWFVSRLWVTWEICISRQDCHAPNSWP